MTASPPATPTSPRCEAFLRGAGLTVTDVATNNQPVEADGHARAGRGAPSRRACTATPTSGRLLDAPSRQSLGSCVARRQGARRLRSRPVRRVHPPAERHPGCHELRPRRRACGPAPAAARRRPPRSSTRRRARRTSARRPRPSTRRSTARRSRSRRAATRRRSTRAPTAPPASSSKGIDGRGVTVAITDAYAAPTILAGRQHVRPAPRPAGLHARGQFQQILPKRPFQLRLRRRGQRRPVRRAGLVRRGDPRRRGRPRDGPGRQRPLRRRAQLLRRPLPARR